MKVKDQEQQNHTTVHHYTHGGTHRQPSPVHQQNQTGPNRTQQNPYGPDVLEKQSEWGVGGGGPLWMCGC